MSEPARQALRSGQRRGRRRAPGAHRRDRRRHRRARPLAPLRHRHRGGRGGRARRRRGRERSRRCGPIPARSRGSRPMPRSSRTPTPARLDVLRDGAVAAARDVIAAAAAGDPERAIEQIGAFRVLCAHRRGDHGAATWRARVESWLAAAIDGFAAQGEWYVGRPLLVTENDYGLRLHNGDTGVVVAGPDGSMQAAFERGGAALRISPSRLGAVETVHAMTIHKAQGSQFQTAAVVLPPESSPILTQELLYTAVTRARTRLIVAGDEPAVRGRGRAPDRPRVGSRAAVVGSRRDATLVAPAPDRSASLEASDHHAQAHRPVRVPPLRRWQARGVRGLGDAGAVRRGHPRRAPRGAQPRGHLRRLAHGRGRDLRPRRRGVSAAHPLKRRHEDRDRRRAVLAAVRRGRRRARRPLHVPPRPRPLPRRSRTPPTTARTSSG